MNPEGIILAAGASTRMGSPKALLLYQNETFLDRLIGQLQGLCARVTVVTGAHTGPIRAGTRRGAAVRWVVNEHYADGQLSSLQCGLRALQPGSTHVLFTLVDHPAVQAETLRLVWAASSGPAAPVVVIPRWRGKRGHPVCCARPIVDELLTLPRQSSAKEVIRAHARYVDVDDPGICADIDDPEDYRALVGAVPEGGAPV